MSCDANDNVEGGGNWMEKIQSELRKIEELTEKTETGMSLAELTDRIASAAREWKGVEEAIRRENHELRKQLSDQKFQLDEMEMERDVLLQQVHTYLEINSSLRIRLEEQRCQNGALKSQLNSDLESKVRILERDKEKLIASNVEKEKEVRKMRFMLQEGNEENEVKALRRQLERALEDKVKAEGRLREVLVKERKAEERCWKGRKREPTLRRSVSEGDVGSERFKRWDGNIVLEGSRDGIADSKLRGLRTEEGSLGTRSDCSEETKKKKFPEPPVYAQLDALRLGLFNVTRKLEFLKTQLVNSGAIKEVKESQRNLKRKAKTLETEVSALEEPKSGCKDVKNLLEDAKILNAKLETLRDEKRRIMETTKQEKEVQVAAEGNDAFSQTTEGGGHVAKTVARLRQAMCECECELDEGSVTREEAFASFTSALAVFILSNVRCFSPGWVNERDEDEAFGEECSSESKETGGGDNWVKLNEKPHSDLKLEIARLRHKIELFKESGGQ